MIDDIDMRIIQLLTKRPNATINEISEKIKIPRSTVAIRIKRMKESEIIRECYYVDSSLISHDDIIMGLDIKPENLIEVISELEKMEEVKEIYMTTGDHVSIIRILVENKRTKEIIEKIKSIKGIRNVYPAIVQKKIK
ncbi:MAG: Lrp/AsnC family transcriptional regulator [Thermoplasmata archaeon]